MANFNFSVSGKSHVVVRMLDASEVPSELSALIKSRMKQAPEGMIFSVAVNGSDSGTGFSFSCTVISSPEPAAPEIEDTGR